MSDLRILHLAIDDKFIDHAFLVFEEAFPKQNDVFIFSKSNDLNYVNLNPKKIIKTKTLITRTPKLTRTDYKRYDLIIFHSFSNSIYPEIFSIPHEIPKIWFGWGYDYYDLIEVKENLVLSETEKLSKKALRYEIRSKVGKIVRLTLNFLGLSKSKKKAIEKLTFFAPVLPSEYDLVLNGRKWKQFPKKSRWNYGTIEDHLLKGFEKEKVDGNAILIGNSASLTCNHIEAFNFIEKQCLGERKLVVPLSYGSKYYSEKIVKIGSKIFGRNFEPLVEFKPPQDYVATIKKCGYVIMNHKRQQAVGNIVIMLHLGARVFLREECPTFSFLREMGVSLSSIQQLEMNPSLLEIPLSDEEREINRKLVSDYWSRAKGIIRTQTLVEQALRAKNR